MKRCSALLCMPIGVSLFLMPANATSLVLGGVMTGFLLALRMLPAFIGMLLVRYGYSMLVRGTKKLLIRGTVYQLIRVYILMHPRISNARVRRMKVHYVARTKAWLMQMRGIRLVFAAIVFASAAVGAWAVIVLIGLMRIVFLLVEPVVDVVARTVVGTMIATWWSLLTVFLRAHVRGPYRMWRDRYVQHNRRWLRGASRKYRDRFHKRQQVRK